MFTASSALTLQKNENLVPTILARYTPVVRFAG